MITYADALKEADALSGLISSLPGANPAGIRSQIQDAALTLHSMLLSLSNAAAVEAQSSAGPTFDALLDWSVSTDGYLREKCIDCAISVQAINRLVRAVLGWRMYLGHADWKTTPEIPAEKLIGMLTTYQSITGAAK
jgi:hypothetical protein